MSEIYSDDVPHPSGFDDPDLQQAWERGFERGRFYERELVGSRKDYDAGVNAIRAAYMARGKED